MRIAFLVTLMCSSLAACASKPPAVTYDAPFDAPFTAALNKPVRMEGVSLEFTKVVEESRCPKHVTCVWQGAATVGLTVLAGEQPQEITLATSPAEAAARKVAGFKVELLDLAPYPDATVRRASMDYVVTLRVTRVE